MQGLLGLPVIPPPLETLTVEMDSIFKSIQLAVLPEGGRLEFSLNAS